MPPPFTYRGVSEQPEGFHKEKGVTHTEQNKLRLRAKEGKWEGKKGGRKKQRAKLVFRLMG